MIPSHLPPPSKGGEGGRQKSTPQKNSRQPGLINPRDREVDRRVCVHSLNAWIPLFHVEFVLYACIVEEHVDRVTST